MTLTADERWTEHLETCGPCCYGPDFCDDGAELVRVAREARDAEQPTYWRCVAHGVRGNMLDASLGAHEFAEHGGASITVMFERG